VVFEDLYWIQKITIILVVIVDSVIIAKFVIACSAMDVVRRKLRILMDGKIFLISWPGDKLPPTFWARFCSKFCNLYASIRYLLLIYRQWFVQLVTCCKCHVAYVRRKVSSVSWSFCSVKWRWPVNRLLQITTASRPSRLLNSGIYALGNLTRAVVTTLACCTSMVWLRVCDLW